jgi:citronellol/citronellal dehydrogenase
MTATALLRDDLLTGRTIVLAGPARPALGEALAALGARVVTFDEQLGEDAAGSWAGAQAPLHALVYDAGRGGRGGRAGRGGREAGGAGEASGGSPQAGAGGDLLLAVTDRAWTAVRAIATGALIPSGDGGKVVLIAPPPRAWHHSGAARAALQNLARTLSVEWARYRITVTAIAPGDETPDEELAALVGYLASPAGDYFSGCEFDLGGAGGA